MDNAPDPQAVREIARTAVQRLATDSVRGRLVETAMAIHEVPYGSVNEWHAMYNAAVEAMGNAIVTVSWPDEQPQDGCPAPYPLNARYECELIAGHEGLHRGRYGGVDATWVAVAEQPQDERDALAEVTAELDAANDDADAIAGQRAAYREEIMRLRARVRELEGAQDERDGDVRAVALDTEITTTERATSLLHDLDARTKERDEARELACVSLDILRNVSDEPMRELYGVEDMDEMPAWFTRYGKASKR